MVVMGLLAKRPETTVTELSTRDELAEAITHMAHRAEREFQVVEPGSDDDPTPWTQRHQAINLMLTAWESAT